MATCSRKKWTEEAMKSAVQAINNNGSNKGDDEEAFQRGAK